MKLNGKALVAVVAMFGSMAAVGCKKSGDAASEAAPAPVTLQADTANADAPAASDERTTVTVAAGTRAAPPALRVERPGRAPSAHHVWQRGYWRYDSPRTAYVWVPGYWENTVAVAPYAPPVAVYEDRGYAPGADYFYAPGYYRWSGRQYVWVYGHWSLRRDAGSYYHGRWERVNGRWEHRGNAWVWVDGTWAVSSQPAAQGGVVVLPTTTTTTSVVKQPPPAARQRAASSAHSSGR
mgnify:CR=1 FL=1